MTMKDLESAAMRLPAARRAKLAASLLASLDEAGAEEIDRAWTDEADHRFRARHRNKSTTVPAAIALAKARESLR